MVDGQFIKTSLRWRERTRNREDDAPQPHVFEPCFEDADEREARIQAHIKRIRSHPEFYLDEQQQEKARAMKRDQMSPRITPELVRCVRRAVARGLPYNTTAQLFRISANAVRNIVKRITYADVE